MGLALFVDCFRNEDSLASVRLGLPADHRLFIKSMPFGVQIAKSVLSNLDPSSKKPRAYSGGFWLQCYRRVLIRS